MRTFDATNPILITSTHSTASLLGKVLWMTTAGFLFTALGAWLAPAIPGFSFIGFMVLSFVLLFAIRFAAQRSPALGLAMFYLFTLVEGVIVGPMIQSYLRLANGQTIVFEAALTTALGMAVMALVAQIATFDYQRVWGYARAALLGLFIVGLVSMFFHFMGPAAYNLYCWAGLAIFSVLLLVDFMRLRDTPSSANPIFLAVRIYLDALNIFLFLLQIFGNGSGRGRRNNGW